MALDEKAVELLEERWRLLTELRKTERVRARLLRPRDGRLRGFLRHCAQTAHRHSLARRVPDRRSGPEALRQHARAGSPASWRATCSRRTPARTTSTSAIPAGTITSRSGTAQARQSLQALRGIRSGVLQPAGRSRRDPARRRDPSKTLLDETLVVGHGRVRAHAGRAEQHGRAATTTTSAIRRCSPARA